ncbi:MAG: hypothetical protein Q9220_004475 [cf. Caloplaca sp. 1 TL-2023]
MDVNTLPEKAPDIPAARVADASSSLSPSSLEHSKPDPYASDDSIDLADKVSERKLLLKVDLAVLPILFLLFLVSFVDRSNLGNARIEGLEKSLGIPPKSNGYNIALFSFTIPYVLFEVPANMLLKKIKPQLWLSGLMFCWGMLLPSSSSKLGAHDEIRYLYDGSGLHAEPGWSCDLPRFHGNIRVRVRAWYGSCVRRKANRDVLMVTQGVRI